MTYRRILVTAGSIRRASFNALLARTVADELGRRDRDVLLVSLADHEMPIYHGDHEAEHAEQEGASYVNIGPLFPTRTKDWPGEFLGIEGLRRIAARVSIPCTVMGGIKADVLTIKFTNFEAGDFVRVRMGLSDDDPGAPFVQDYRTILFGLNFSL